MSVYSRDDVSRLLQEWYAGSEAARDAVIPLIYPDLKRIARRYVVADKHTLSEAGVVNEAFLRLVERPINADSRIKFLAIASSLMKKVVIDHARPKRALKRGGGWVRITFTPELNCASELATEALALRDALSELETLDPLKHKIFELYFCGGFTQEEVANVIGLPLKRTVREIKFIRKWIESRIRGSSNDT